MSQAMAMARGVNLRKIAALGLVCLLGSATALAQDNAAIELDWDAPSECPDRAWVMRTIAARVGSAAAQPTAAVRASARIEKRDASYRLTLRTDQGERQLNAASCEELAGSAALILAFIVDPEHSAEAAPVAEQPAAAGGDDFDAELSLSGHARVEWLVDVGMLARAATGPGIALGLTLADTSLELSAGFLLNNTVRYVAAEAGGQRSLAQLHAFLAQLGVCQRVVANPALSACLVGEHMRITADPDDALLEPSTPSAPVWTILLAARAAIPIGTRFAWVLELGLGVPVLGARFRVDGIGTIHETGDVVGRLRTGVGLSF